MLNALKHSFRLKLLLSLLSVALVPYIVTMVILFVNTQDDLKQSITKDLEFQRSIIVNELESHLKNVQKDFLFISTLQIMDDIQTNDLDKRITTLLEAKKRDLELDGEFVCANTNGVIIAASNSTYIGKNLPIIYKNQTTNLHQSALTRTRVISVTKSIYASYDPTSEIGLIVMLYGEKNFDHFLYNLPSRTTYIFDPQTKLSLGHTTLLPQIEENSTVGNCETKNELLSYCTLKSPIINGWKFILSEQKSSAMKIIDDFYLFMYLSLGIGFILIVTASTIISNKVTRPIQELSKIALSVTTNRDFSQRVVIESDDELKLLANSFNDMIEKTGLFLSQIEDESLDRLRLFVKLVEMFNSISQAKSEDDAINVAVNELKQFLDCSDVFFTKNIENSEFPAFAVEVHNYKTDSSSILGYITISQDHCSSELDYQFFGAIAKMVAVQIEKIVLFSNTQAASQAKSSFISNMSHELRTPLNGIIGFAQFLSTLDNFPSDYRSIPKKIETAGGHLLTLINDILDMAKIEAGKVDVSYSEVSLKELIDKAHAIVSYQLDEKGLTFVNTTADITLHTDVKLLSQIVLNILSNSIKFTEVGGIVVDTYRNENMIFIEVSDTGIGFSAEDGQKLFQEFEQIENPLQKKHKGTGLGLSLSRSLSRLLGGDLQLISKGQNQGTLAIIQIPLNKVV